MSDEVVQEPVEQDAEEAGESSRIGGAIVTLVLAAVAVLAMKAVVTAAPYVAYFVAGVLVCHAWHRVGTWRASRRDGQTQDEADEEEPPDVVEALQHLGRGGNSVLLTQLRKRLRVADTKAVKALLKDEGIRVRAGVRTSSGNGPGVHHEDIPTPPPPEDAPSVKRCSCSSEPTTPTPTTAPEGGPGEGLRVVPLGTEAKIVYDPNDTVRHHRIM